jgi:hypothetical protein
MFRVAQHDNAAYEMRRELPPKKFSSVAMEISGILKRAI